LATPLKGRPAAGRDPRRLAHRLARRVALEVEALDRLHLRLAGERLLGRILAAGELLAAGDEGLADAGRTRSVREGLAGCRFLLEVLSADGAVAPSSLREIATGLRVLERTLPGGHHRVAGGRA